MHLARRRVRHDGARYRVDLRKRQRLSRELRKPFNDALDESTLRDIVDIKDRGFVTLAC